MNNNLQIFTIDSNATIMEALTKIDINSKGFLIVCDDNCTVAGVLTDGDIRRAFIAGYTTNNKVKEVCKAKYTFLDISCSISEAIEIFRKDSINFIPIIGNSKKLINIITKKQLHSLLLLDIHADLSYDFCSLDENIINHEIYQRPWGFYKTTVMNSYFQSKVISVSPNSKLSLQSHNHREEYWIIAHGTGVVQIDSSFKNVTVGDWLFIPKASKHRLINDSDKTNLIVIEVQIGDYFGEDDIIRYDDIYGRM